MARVTLDGNAAVGAASQRSVPDPAGFERANYLDTLTRYADTFLR